MKKYLSIILAFMIAGCHGGHPKEAASTQTEQAEVAAEDLDAQYAVDLLKPGTVAPELTLNDLRGKLRSLSEFRGKKVVLVFWASWCPDCRAEAPELRAMQAAVDPSKVAFVSVSYDRDFDTLCNYVDDNLLGGVQLFDPAGKRESKVGAEFGVKWIPSLYLISEDGEIEVATVVASKIAAALGTTATSVPANSSVCNDDSCSPQ